MSKLNYLSTIFTVILCFDVEWLESFASDDGGWYTDPEASVVSTGPCNIVRRNVDSLSQFEFLERYAFDEPVVVIQNAGYNKEMRWLSSRDTLIQKYGNKHIRLSTANTHSYQKVDVTLEHYVNDMLKPQRPNQLGNETFYWFGDNNHSEWHELFDSYHPPPYTLPNKVGAYSYGVAGAGTGVPFHFHGPGFAEVIYGRKRWFLYPPNEVPLFHPNKTSLQWLLEDYPKLSVSKLPYECTIGPGEVIYFPDLWWHSTLNIDTSAFISTFLG